MKSAIIVSFFLLLGSTALQAQTTPSTSTSNAPDKSWVLKDYPNATDISWHKEKNGQIEFEFINDRKKTKVWYNDAGQVLKTKVEAAEKCDKKDSNGKKESEGDDDDDDGHR